jgi:DNA-binding Lrp family transcriptional regulator
MKPMNPNLMKIMRYLQEDPTAEQADIANTTGLTLSQVKHGLKELEDGDHIQKGRFASLKSLGYVYRFRVDIFVSPINLRDGKGGLPDDKSILVNTQETLGDYIMNILPQKELFRDRIFVQDVRILLGHPADLSATVLAIDNESMLSFVTKGLRMCQAISQTSTALEAWSTVNGKTSAKPR